MQPTAKLALMKTRTINLLRGTSVAPFWIVLVLLLTSCGGSTIRNDDDDSVAANDDDVVDDDDSTNDDDDASDDDDDTASQGSAGCGLPPADPLGGVALTIDAGPTGDGVRGYFLHLPQDYNPTAPHRLVVGFPGTNWIGQQIRPYLALERSGAKQPEIHVYPDPLWRDFAGWGTLGGWVMGPNANPAHGDGDLNFVDMLLDRLEAEYCVDTERIFATGHSWGGDMAQVVACFLGDRFTASAPVAANRPYWFEPSVTCLGDTAVWTLFGFADDHFTSQGYPGQYGDECRDFWLAERGCNAPGSFVDLDWGEAEECVEYTGCDAPVRYCLYDEAAGHGVPGYYSQAVVDWFRSF